MYTYEVRRCGNVCLEHYRNDGLVVIAEYPDGSSIIHYLFSSHKDRRCSSLEEAMKLSEDYNE